MDVERLDYQTFCWLHSIFHFTVDACASAENALLPRYWTKDDDCTRQDWTGEVVYCNPPFSNPKPMIEKASMARTAVFVLPSRWVGANQLRGDVKLILVPPRRLRYWLPGRRTSGPDMGELLPVWGEVRPEQIEAVQRAGWAVYQRL